jgi:hypothetical protein
VLTTDLEHLDLDAVRDRAAAEAAPRRRGIGG